MRRLLWLALATLALLGCRANRQNAVTVYVSEDQVFSEPVLKDFERDRLITVRYAAVDVLDSARLIRLAT